MPMPIPMPMPTPPTPTLATFDSRPSWHNRAGRVDRSCCFTLTAAQLWRLIPEDGWQYKPAPSKPAPNTRIAKPPVHNRPAKPVDPGDPNNTVSNPVSQRSAPRRPDRVGLITLTAEDLYFLHRDEKSSPLRGDYRTAKANAFKPAADATAWWNHFAAGRDSERKSASDRKRDAARYPRTPHNRRSALDPPAINPNRGAGFAMGLKKLGLPFDWYTTLTIERYVQHAKLKQHFLVCPVCGPRNDESDGAGGGGMGVPPVNERQETDGRDGHPTSNKNRPPTRGLPAGRVTKLYLPLCTEREWEDAQRAHLWLTTHQNPNRPYTAAAAGLLTRYAELFPGRQLRCRACLGLRYGEVKGLK